MPVGKAAPLGLLLGCILWAGCAVGRNYERPPVVVPDVYRVSTDTTAAGATPPDTIGFGDLPWWGVFGDEQLQALIRTALVENRDLRFAVAAVEEARGVYRLTRADLFPDVRAVVAGTATRVSRSGPQAPPAGANNRIEFVDVGGNLSYQLDVFGGLRRATEAARADLLATDEARRTVVITLIGAVAQAYFELRALDGQLEIARRTLEGRQDSVELIRVRQEGGVASLLEVRQAEAQLAITAAQVPEFERQIALKEDELSVLIGRNPSAIPRGRSLTEQPSPPTIPVDLPSRLLDRRPDIRSAEEFLAASNARVGEAKALFFPQFTLTGLVEWSATAVRDLFTDDALETAAEGFGEQSLFDGGRRGGNLQAARGRFKQALADYELTILQAFREVSDALVTIDKLGEVRVQRETLVSVLRDAARLARARWLGGVSSYIEVLDAERSLFDAELDLTATKRDQLIAVVQLYQALGGGWAAADTLPRPAPPGPPRSPDAEE